MTARCALFKILFCTSVFTFAQSPSESASISGAIHLGNGEDPLTSGFVLLYRIADKAVNPIDTVPIGNDGTYTFTEIAIGSYLLLVKGDVAPYNTLVPTYYPGTYDWQKADTLVIKEPLRSVDVTMISVPICSSPEAEINGFVELDGGTKVAGLACFLKRKTRSDSNDYVMYDYVQTNIDGEFVFSCVLPGEYEINIQYPGIPMDTTSQIRFTVSENLEGQVFQLNATITEEGISVNIDEILGIEKPYLKEVKLYPNPTDGKLAIDYLVYRRVKDLKLKIMDLNGMLISERQLESQMGAHRTELDLTDVKSGVYFMILTDEAASFQYVIKIGKQ